MSRPFIESIINTAALTLTSYGTIQITLGNYWGMLIICFAIFIEWIKYTGRKNSLW